MLYHSCIWESKFLDTRSEYYTLAPGEQAVVSSRGIEKRAVDVNEYIGWAQGVYVFNNKRLGDIMKTFERWYDVHVYYEKESLRDLT